MLVQWPLFHRGQPESILGSPRAPPIIDARKPAAFDADTGLTDLSPQSPGLLALALGLSVNFPDDHAMLEHGMTLYDALYAWLRSARSEQHNARLFEAQE